MPPPTRAPAWPSWLGAEIEDTGHAMEWLHGYYKAADGLQRPEGLWIDGHPDYTGISTWILACLPAEAD